MSANKQTDFKGELNTVEFHGQVLQIVHAHGRPYVPIRTICVNLGIDWNAQRQRIHRDQVLSEGVCMIHAPSPGGSQEMLCLPLEYLNGWLFGIEERRVASQIREALIVYKREAYGALYNYFVKGFALNQERLATDDDARDAALQELRKLRTSDKELYRKVTDAIAHTSVDYEVARSTAPQRVSGLFARIQDTFHVAVAGMTSADIVLANADASKPLLGMTSYAGDPNKITVQDVRTGKNYLDKIKFRKLEILYEQLFLFAENKIISGESMTLAKWEDQLQKLLMANGYEPRGLYAPGNFAPQRAVEKASTELRKYKERQMIARKTPASA